MAMKLYSDIDIQNIANAIRNKNQSSDTYKVSEMATAINAIESGLSDADLQLLTDEIDNLTGAYPLEIIMPVKGDLITIENQQYRVLKTEGTNAEVLAMFEASSSQKFKADSSTSAYFGSDLDTYLNTTYYNTLSTEMKNAIVSTSITQYKYWINSSLYDATTHASYADYSTKTALTSDTRNIYALDVEDIEEYFNHTFSTSDIWTMFWNTSQRPSLVTHPWLRSAFADVSNHAWYVVGSDGRLLYNSVSTSYAARPAFKIDLSKITWTKQEV